MEEFKDFSKYMSSIEGKCRVGLAKVIPPPGWAPRRSYENMQNFLIQKPIIQNFYGTQGVMKQLNIERKSIRVSEFEKLATEAEATKSRSKRGASAAEASATEGSTAFSTPSKAGPGRGKKRKLQADPSQETDTPVVDQGEVSPSALPLPARTPSQNGDSSSVSGEGGPALTAEVNMREEESQSKDLAADLASAELSSSSSSHLQGIPSGEALPDMTLTTGDLTNGAVKIKKKPGVPKVSQSFSYVKKEDTRTQQQKDDDYAELERQYWKSISFSTPCYGADSLGTLFDEDVNVWNVGRLGDLLDKLPAKMPGVNEPYLYVGMWKATFAWHVEDMDLFSINYIHFGAPKHWYVIPIPYRRKFEALARQLYPDEHRNCAEFLRHKMCHISPTVIQKHGIPVRKIVHEEGQFMITFPGAYHAGFNIGFNCAESINFALESWIEIGKQAASCECRGDTVRIDMRVFTGEPETESEGDEEEEDDEEDENFIVEIERDEDERPRKEKKDKRKRVRAERKEKSAAVITLPKNQRNVTLPPELTAFNEPGRCNICLLQVDDKDLLSCFGCKFTCHRGLSPHFPFFQTPESKPNQPPCIYFLARRLLWFRE